MPYQSMVGWQKATYRSPASLELMILSTMDSAALDDVVVITETVHVRVQTIQWNELEDVLALDMT